MNIHLPVQDVWDIVEAPAGEPFLDLAGNRCPFGVRRTAASGASHVFPCRSIEDASDKLQAIARELDRQGYKLGLG